MRLINAGGDTEFLSEKESNGEETKINNNKRLPGYLLYVSAVAMVNLLFATPVHQLTSTTRRP